MRDAPKSMLGTFAVFAVVGVAAGVALPARAWSVRQNAAECFIDAPNTVANHGGNAVNGNHPTAFTRLTCPVTDTSFTPKTGITALSVFGFDASTTASVSANACIQFAGLNGGTCGATSFTSAAGTGLFVLSPVRTVWGAANASDLPYIFVALPPAVPSASNLRGYAFSG